jgi:hypothetical protein
MKAIQIMKTRFLLLALLGGFALNSSAIVSGPDNIIYGTITLSGTPITAADTNVFVAARLQASGPPIATYTMGSLPRAGDYYSLRISVESVGATLAPNAVQAGQLIFVDVDDTSGVRAQTTLTIGAPGQITLLNFGGASITAATGALDVAILPSAVITAGAQWEVDGGPSQSAGTTVSNLAIGSHTISFTPVSGWLTPSNQTVSIASGATASASGIYTQPNAGLTLLTNGSGTIHHSAWPANLVVGNNYTAIAVPNAKNLFVSWVGGTNQPYSVLSTSNSYTFSMQPHLLLEANFVSNELANAAGTYRGLFAPTNVPRAQTNSGSFLFTINSHGVASGSLTMGKQSSSFAGPINPDGSAALATKPAKGQSSLAVNLQMNFDGQSVSGTVSNTDFAADLAGHRDVFGATNKAFAYEGQYTFVISGTTNPAVGPFGTSYGTVKISAAGAVTMTGNLADGTAVSQTSVVSKDGYWPVYVDLYNGKGSLWGWNYFSSHTITSPLALSWINESNSAKSADYRGGFTNQDAAVLGTFYLPSQSLPGGLVTTLQDPNVPYTVTISNLFEDTNDLKLKTNKANGVITGSFANPANPNQMLQIHGVVLQGQTNAQGYFFGADQQTGSFSLDPPQ